jgi:hypothetical protein
VEVNSVRQDRFDVTLAFALSRELSSEIEPQALIRKLLSIMLSRLNLDRVVFVALDGETFSAGLQAERTSNDFIAYRVDT